MCSFLYKTGILHLLIRKIISKSIFLSNFSLKFTDLLTNHVKVETLRSFFSLHSKEAKSELLGLKSNSQAVRVVQGQQYHHINRNRNRLSTVKQQLLWHRYTKSTQFLDQQVVHQVTSWCHSRERFFSVQRDAIEFKDIQVFLNCCTWKSLTEKTNFSICIFIKTKVKMRYD